MMERDESLRTMTKSEQDAASFCFDSLESVPKLHPQTTTNNQMNIIRIIRTVYLQD
jgi:hypothetical protein